MGRVISLITKIRKQDTYNLMERFKHLIGVQAIHTYLDTKKDVVLDVEIRLTEEELFNRLKSDSSITTISIEKK